METTKKHISFVREQKKEAQKELKKYEGTEAKQNQAYYKGVIENCNEFLREFDPLAA